MIEDEGGFPLFRQGDFYIFLGRRRLEDFDDAVVGGFGVGVHGEEHGEHAERKHDLHDVLNKCHEIPHFHGAGVDTAGAEVEDGDHAEVKNQIKGREHGNQVIVHLFRCATHGSVHLVETLILVAFLTESANHANPREPFPKVEVDLVHELANAAKAGNGFSGDGNDHGEKHRPRD